MTEIANLVAFLKQRNLAYTDLARQMKWSPTFIYGALGGAWELSPSFRRAFRQTFGDEVADQVFANGHKPPEETA